MGFLTVVIFQGAFTYYMAAIGIKGSAIPIDKTQLILLLACSFQIAGAYPLTQIYQHQADKADGVITLSYKLGFTGTFVFTALMFLCCNLAYWIYFHQQGKELNFYAIQVFFLPIVVYFAFWFYSVTKDKHAANFKNTMRMNTVAGICMNLCFLLLCFMNH